MSVLQEASLTARLGQGGYFCSPTESFGLGLLQLSVPLPISLEAARGWGQGVGVGMGNGLFSPGLGPGAWQVLSTS